MIVAMTTMNEEKRPSGEMSIDGVVYVTTSRAKEIAAEMGQILTTTYIAAAVRRGNEGKGNSIEGAKRMWDAEKAPWLLPKASFLDWLGNRRSPGRPIEN